MCTAKVHTFHWEIAWKLDNPDGMKERQVIAINNKTPLPTIRVKTNDRVIIHATNKLGNQNTSIHFHGLFQNGSNSMDGPEFVTQCPIAPGSTYIYDFKVPNQEGTYWYHSHSGPQYGDGLRGMFIIEPENVDAYPFKFDDKITLSLTDWYHKEAKEIKKTFMSRFNPTGAEPIPQNALFNYTRNATWHVAPKTKYFIQIANMGMFVSQYLFIENHNFTIVEVDGVYVKPQMTDSIYIAVGQRYGVLIETGDFHENFRFLNVIDKPMLDTKPAELQYISTNWIVYDDKKPLPPALENNEGSFDSFLQNIDPFDDFNLKPLTKSPLMEAADYTINLDFKMENLGDGVTYALFNNFSYVAPKVPTLMTLLSSGKLASNDKIYGTNTNTFVLQHNEVIDIILNNMDPGKHPFHLHGHTFQVIERSPPSSDDNPITYDPNNHAEFPLNPVIRDTVMVNANGYVVLRFCANNPGVWFFHCHVDWHLEQGLAIVLVEAPFEVQKSQSLSSAQLHVCKQSRVPTSGNAAGRYGKSEKDWLNLEGENIQPQPLPPGFTLKGYIAFFLCAAFACWGLLSIYKYGIEDVAADDGEEMIMKLESLLEENGGLGPEDTRPLTGEDSNA